MFHVHGYFLYFLFEKLFIKVVITGNFTVSVCCSERFCWKNWLRAWRFRILITKRYKADIPSFLFRWSLLADAANARVVKVVAYLYVIISFKYVLCYQLFTCLNFLLCCFDILAIWLVLRNVFAEKNQLVWTTRRPQRILSEYAK